MCAQWAGDGVGGGMGTQWAGVVGWAHSGQGWGGGMGGNYTERNSTNCSGSKSNVFFFCPLSGTHLGCVCSDSVALS